MLKILGMMALATVIIALFPVIVGFLAIAGPIVAAIFVLIFPILAVGCVIGYSVGKKDKDKESK